MAIESSTSLTPDLKDLLRRLAGDLRADNSGEITSIPELHYYKYGDYFRRGDARDSNRATIRLEVLRAVGNCRTLEKFQFGIPEGWGLSPQEWDALLTPLHFNHRIREIVVPSDTGEELSPYVRTLVEHSLRLQRLKLYSCFGAAASGLEANLSHELNYLYVWWQAEGWVHSATGTAKILQSAPSLEEVELNSRGTDEEPGDEDEALREMSDALQHCSCLKTIHLTMYTDYVSPKIEEILTRTYAQGSSHPPLQTLEIPWTSPIGCSTLTSLIAGNIQRIDFSREFSDWDPEMWRSVGVALTRASTLQRLHLTLFAIWKEDKRMAGEILETIWSASRQSPLLHVTLYLTFYSDDNQDYDQFIQTGLRGTYLTEVTIEVQDITKALQSFAQSLGDQKSVQDLTIIAQINAWDIFFISDGLRRNTSIRRLKWRDSNRTLTDDHFKQTLDLLQANPYIEEFDVTETEWVEGGKAALIQQALERNKEQAEYFSTLSAENLKFNGARAGRIFFCGPPFAGKTQLKATMMRTKGIESTSKSLVRHRIHFLPRKDKEETRRTKGIEVELLVDNEFRTISLWDLGGQDIFRALQNILFPRLNQALLFVFVFNPFEDNRPTLKSDPYDDFDEHLRTWLRFIVSNTQVRGNFLVRIQILVTHQDKLKRAKSKLHIEVLEELVEKVRKDYESAIELCSTGGDARVRYIRHIDAKSSEEVKPVTEFLLSLMEDELRLRTKPVPKICSDIASSLLKLPREVRECPVWQRAKFEQFLVTEWIQKYIPQIFSMSEEKKRSISDCIVSYLHNVGAIYVLSSGNASPRTDWVVLDLNWLTRDLIGELVIDVYQFDVKSGQTRVRRATREGEDTTDGMLTSSRLITMIEKTLHLISIESVEVSTVRELLLSIDLCYKVETERGEDRYFAPLFCPRVCGSTRPITWGRQSAEDMHFGIRVAVHDNQTTSFTTSFFPRFQIHLRRLLRAQGVKDESFVFSRDHVKFYFNDAEIIVEVDGDELIHVDILVKFSGDHRRDWVMEYVQKHVVAEMIDFCASDKGCPGVQPVTCIMRTECVRKLIPLALRKNQVISTNELKTQLVAFIDDRLGSGETEWKHLIEYRYSWSHVGTLLEMESEPVQNLLSKRHMNEALQHVKEKLQAVSQAHRRLQRVYERMNNLESQSIRAGPSSSDPEPEPLTTSLLSMSSFHEREKVEKTMVKCLDDQTRYLVKRMDAQTRELTKHIDARFQQLQQDIRDLAESLSHLRNLMGSTTGRVDQLIRFVTSRETASPRRPYFTYHDVSLLGKVQALLTFAHPVRLHLMCEARDGPHIVEEQEGLEISVEKQGNFYPGLRRLSVMSMQMVWVLLRVGVQVTTGLGGLLPGLTNLETGLVVGASVAVTGAIMDQLKAEVDKSLPSQEETRMAWDTLKHVLAEYLEPAKCAEVFRLHRVVYRNCEDDPFAWLCSSCIEAGRRNLLLEST